MKSSQINFFITADDLPQIDAFLKEKKCIYIRNNVSKVEVSFATSIVNLRDKDVLEVYLTTEEFSNEIQFEYLDGKDYYYIDINKSYVIQFSFGGLYPYSDKELHRGRFYCVHQFFDNQSALQRKHEQFLTWVKTIFKHFKSNFLKSYTEYPDDLFSQKSIEWIEAHNAKPVNGGLKFVSPDVREKT